MMARAKPAGNDDRAAIEGIGRLNNSLPRADKSKDNANGRTHDVTPKSGVHLWRAMV